MNLRFWSRRPHRPELSMKRAGGVLAPLPPGTILDDVCYPCGVARRATVTCIYFDTDRKAAGAQWIA
jgi:hypothetical protein